MAVAINITGSGRLWCITCSRTCPSYFPSCPDCGSVRFHSLHPEPEPLIELTTEFFEHFSDVNQHEVMKIIYEEKANRLIDNFESKGYLLYGNRSVTVTFEHWFDFSPQQLNIEMATQASFDRFFTSERSFILNQFGDFYVIGLSNVPVHTLLTRLGEFNPPLPAPSDTIFYPKNHPPEDVEYFFCSICRLGNHDPDLHIVPPSDDEATDTDSVGSYAVADVDVDEDDDVVDEEGEGDDVDEGDGVDEEIDDVDRESDDMDVEGDDMHGVGDVMDPRSYRLLDPCGHMFHPSCINNWFERGNSLECPECRQIMVTNNEDFNAWALVHNPRQRN